jgi:hypothetical protein
MSRLVMILQMALPCYMYGISFLERPISGLLLRLRFLYDFSDNDDHMMRRGGSLVGRKWSVLNVCIQFCHKFPLMNGAPHISGASVYHAMSICPLR